MRVHLICCVARICLLYLRQVINLNVANSMGTLNNAWKNAESLAMEKDSVEVNRELLTQIYGGEKSAGYICSVSGKCNSTGESCGGSIREILDSILLICFSKTFKD